MAYNQSVPSLGSAEQQSRYRLVIVQVLVIIFLYINCLMITTFFMKEVFYRSTRYILFINALMSDCLYLIITNLLLIFISFRIYMQMWLCLIIVVVSSLHNFITPVTLTAMTLERYVAICMPLQHGQICSAQRALYGILVIHGVSFIPCLIMILAVFTTVNVSFYREDVSCTVEKLTITVWQSHLRSGVSQFYFLVMLIIIIFSYIKIMVVAQAASAENKKASKKGLQTVSLHAFQLLLCLIQFWCPFVETALLQISLVLYINIRYMNYIMFSLAPRCLSPLIYGLRDKEFFVALRYYALWGLYKRKISLQN
ncbi:hypothetical protein NL108_009623 [Boleophthalmus pectinirostris]|uniref:odorant receptor 131-2-like n=1 Tax=Boleophthalmus pectinirostris TaxID=150288 RepID=UPI0024318953|nr:odorant receptor 131-2-like [Boleophthalmus pectinirostris]KAJ0055663.1 hypothetical protein NL108_009623 [Boleophthalmus pectinirostris]